MIIQCTNKHTNKHSVFKVKETSNQKLKNKKDKVRLKLIKRNLIFINHILKNYYIHSQVDKKALYDIRWILQDKYIAVSLHLALHNNDNIILNEILFNYTIYYNDKSCNGLLKYACLIAHGKRTKNNINMYDKIQEFNSGFDNRFDIEECILVALGSNLITFFKTKNINDYYQGGFLLYVSGTVQNVLRDLYKKVNRCFKHFYNRYNHQKSDTKKFISKDKFQEIKYQYNHHLKVFSSYFSFSDGFIEKYKIKNLSERQIDILKILSCLNIDEKISKQDIANILNCNISSIKRDLKVIKQFFPDSYL